MAKLGMLPSSIYKSAYFIWSAYQCLQVLIKYSA